MYGVAVGRRVIYDERVVTRREWLTRSASGFGGVALAAMMGDDRARAADSSAANPLAVKPPHFQATAKSVIFLYMDGGPGQMDTFDPKPRLRAEHGLPIQLPELPTTVFNITDKVFGSPFEFSQHGDSGLWVSDLFPHVAECADDLCVVNSMVADHSEHTAANYFVHTGSGFQGNPSAGAWVTYGLGSECDNLPGFIVLDSGLIPPGGMDCFGSGFLPASYQGTLFRRGEHPIADIVPREPDPALQVGKLDLIRKLNRGVVQRLGSGERIEATISNTTRIFECRARCQRLGPNRRDGGRTRTMYGLDEDDTRRIRPAVLAGRRMVAARGSVIELLSPARRARPLDSTSGSQRGHRDQRTTATDKPIAACSRI